MAWFGTAIAFWLVFWLDLNKSGAEIQRERFRGTKSFFWQSIRGLVKIRTWVTPGVDLGAFFGGADN